MRKQIIQYGIILTIAFLLGESSFAQKKDVEFKNVQSFFKSEDYDLAVPYLEELNTKYPGKAGLNFLLGYAYYNTTNQRYKAVSWFEASKTNLGSISINSRNIDVAPYQVFYFLGDLYQQLDNFQYAYTNYFTAIRLIPAPENKNSILALEALKYSNNLHRNIYPYQVEKLKIINQDLISERCLVQLQGKNSSDIRNFKMIYQSNEGSERYGLNKTTWGLQSYNLSNNDDEFQNVNELLPLFSYGPSIILSKKNLKGYSDLYKADFVNGSFINVIALDMINELNSNETSLVVYDENTLLFSSDRKGGSGGFDIWRVNKTGGEWGNPKNLGDIINTEFNENYISSFSRTLYFSSDRPGGFGKYDIYSTGILEGGMASHPKLMQYPVNSGGNDIDPRQFNDDIIIFSSDRGAKDYDFYYVDKTIPVKEFKIIGEIPEEFLGAGEEGMYNDAIVFDNLISKIQNSDIKTAVTTIDEMETSQAIQVVSDLELDQAVDIMENIEREKAIDIIDGMEVEKAIDIVGAMSLSASIDVIGAVNEITSVQIVEEMETQKAAILLDQIDLEKATKILEGMEVEKAVDIVDEFVTEKTVEIINQMDPESAGRIVGQFDDAKAIQIIEGIEVEKAVGVLGNMEEDKTKRIVDKFREEMEEGGENDKIVAIIKSYFADQVRIKESVIFKTVYFSFNSSELLILTRRELIVLIDFMNENPTIKIEVVGHTDHIGDWDVNLKISHDRAEEVFKFLRTNNIEKERIIFYGKGPAQPVDTNETDDGRQNNRRVEVILLQ